MRKQRVGLIGAGNIGGELASLLVQRQLGDVILHDVPAKQDYCKGKALDLEQATAQTVADVRVIGTSNWGDVADADVLIVTAGIPRKPGQSRDDLVASNLPIIREVADQAKRHCPAAFSIIVSNPLDAMVYEFKRRTGAKREMVVGMAGVLDSSRLALFLARELDCSIKDVRAMVLGGHGDDMVPVLSNTTVNGIPIEQLVSAETLAGIVGRTRNGGGEIVRLMGTSAYYAPAASAVAMAEAYLRDQKRLLPCAAYLDGEYGFTDLYMGVPVIIGAGGVEKVIELDLSESERRMLQTSASSVQKVIDIVKSNSDA